MYATFLNRAFDQVLLDVALHNCPVTFVLDRAGLTGEDGASHNGMWDLSLLQLVPTLRIAAPRDAVRLRELLREAVDIDDGPSVIRYAKGAVPAEIPSVSKIGSADVLHADPHPELLILGVGSMAPLALEVAAELRERGLTTVVVDPRWVKPLDVDLVEYAAAHHLVISIEDNGVQGGIGATLLHALSDLGSTTRVRIHGISQEFPQHAKRDALMKQMGLTVESITSDAISALGLEVLGNKEGSELR